MERPKYILIAGTNGTGKSTLYYSLPNLHSMKRVNADEILRNSGGDWRNTADLAKAGKLAVKNISDFFASEISFNQETTLCGKTILKNIDKAKAAGYYIELHYVGVESVDTLMTRIKKRIEAGGHGIPESDVERRYRESFRNLKAVLTKCDLAVIYDNTEKFERIAVYNEEKLEKLTKTTPEWYHKLFERSIEE